MKPLSIFKIGIGILLTLVGSAFVSKPVHINFATGQKDFSFLCFGFVILTVGIASIIESIYKKGN